MILLKKLFGAIVLAFAMISFSSNVTSCSKTDTVHDTTYVNITVRDTTVQTITDSIYDLTDGLVAYFTFNGGSLNDSSGMNNNIYIDSNISLASDRFGNPNNAYSFNGVNSFMRVPNSPSINPDNITIYAIVKINGFYTGPCGGNQILSKGYPYTTNGFYGMEFFDFTSNCGTPNQSIEVFAGTYGDNNPEGSAAGAANQSDYISTGVWYYLIFTYDGTTAKYFINGQLVNSEAKSNVTFTPNSNDLFIGKHENPAYPYYLNGVIDEIRIYNKALSNGEISQLLKSKD